MIYNVKESGRRIKELRKQKGYTQESFADDIGISVRTYSGRENNLSIKIKKEEREIIKKFLYNIIQGI